MRPPETLALAAACLAVGAGSAELYHSQPPPVTTTELRVVYFDPDKGRAVECLATEVDATRDGGLKLWYGSGTPPQEVKVNGVVVIRPHNTPAEQ